MSKIDNSRLDKMPEVAPEVTQVKGKRLRVGLGGIDSSTGFSWVNPESQDLFYTCWEKDDSEDGHRIMQRMNQGFEFVRPEEVSVAKTNIHKTSSGSYVRVSAGRTTGGWLYLMKQPMEFRLEDLADEQEAAMSPMRSMQDKARNSPNGVFEVGQQDIRKTN